MVRVCILCVESTGVFIEVWSQGTRFGKRNCQKVHVFSNTGLSIMGALYLQSSFPCFSLCPFACVDRCLGNLVVPRRSGMLSYYQALQIMRKIEKQQCETKKERFIVPIHRTVDAKSTGQNRRKHIAPGHANVLPGAPYRRRQH